MRKLDNLTGVVVNYCTPVLLRTAIESIRRFYDFPIIVIEGSEEPVEIDYPNIEIIKVGYNVGHGLGMDMGIKMSHTDKVLTFDTDIKMNKPCLELMLEEMKEDTYAIGKLYLKDYAYFHLKNEGFFNEVGHIMSIIHPSFQIVSKKGYLKYAPYISDGAPTVLSYHDIDRHRKEKEILIDFPVLDYIEHRNAGTRDRVEKTEYQDENNIHWKEKWKGHVEANPI